MADLESLVARLHSPNERARARSVFLLGISGNEQVLELLISTLKDPSAKVRRQAVFALSKFADPRTVNALMVALQDRDIEVRRKTIAALGKLRVSQSVGALVDALRHNAASDIAECTCRALALMGSSIVNELMQAYEKETQDIVRACLLSALGWINDSRSRYLSILALGDPSEEVREVALAIQKRAFDPDAVGALIALLDDPRLYGRAISILGNLGNPNAIGPLEKFAADSSRDNYFRQLARDAIAQISQGKRGGFPLWV